MIKPLAPSVLRGCLGVCLSLGVCLLVILGSGYPTTALAQEPGKPTGKKPESKEATKKDADQDKETPEPKDPPKKHMAVEVMIDPNAQEALPIEKLKTAGQPLRSRDDIKDTLAMAAGDSPTDRATILRFVNGMVAMMTDRSTVKAWLDEVEDPKEALRAHQKSLAVHTATAHLIEALNSAKSKRNDGFLQVYNDVLVQTLPPLLKNHLLPRTEAIIVLAQSASPAAANVFLAQLKDPNQTVWVKLWSAQGLTNIAANGTRVDATLGASGAIKAGKALADFLESDKELPWPVTWRSLEALGAMRQAADPNDLAKAEMASAAMTSLVDPDANIRVRGMAAWALGMVRVNPAIPKYNFGLVAYEIGQFAARCGEDANRAVPETHVERPKREAEKEKEKAKAKEKSKSKGKVEEKEKEAPKPAVVEEPGNPVLADLYTALLVKELYQAFHGMDGARESGLLRVQPGQLGSATPYVQKVADLESSVAKASVELIRATGGQINERKKALADRVAQLKQFLAKNPPKDYHLVADGPEFRSDPAAAGEGEAEKANPGAAAGGK